MAIGVERDRRRPPERLRCGDGAHWRRRGHGGRVAQSFPRRDSKSIHPIVQLKATLHNATDAEKAEYDKRLAAAKAFDNAMRVTAKNYKEFIEGLQTALLPVLKSSQ